MARRPKTEQELLDHACRVLSLAEMPASVWKSISDEGFITDALDPHLDEGLADLINACRSRLAIFRAGQQQPRSRQTRDKPVTTRDVAAREHAFSHYLARLAAERPDVRQFREAVLGGRLLKGGEVGAFLRSEMRPATRRPGQFVAYMDFEAANTLNVPVSPGTVIETIHDLVAELTNAYPWSKAEAAMFVLCGHCPIIDALVVHERCVWADDYVRGLFTIEVEPWMPAALVLKAFRDVQRRVLGGRENRPVRQRRLKLLEFVTTHTATSGERPPWSALMSEWNRSHPTWQYEDVRNFAGDYRRAERLIVFPHYA